MIFRLRLIVAFKRNYLIKGEEEKFKSSQHWFDVSIVGRKEEALVSICIHMGTICQPLAAWEGIKMMNNLMEGTELRRKIEEFQRARKLGSKALVFGKVGRGWWRGFLQRNGHHIVRKWGERFAMDRSKWITLANIDQMYDIIYNEMVEAKIVKRLEGFDKV